MSSPTKLGPLVQGFFTDFLCNQKRASPQTIASCRDTFRILLPFVKARTGIEPAVLRVSDLDTPVVLAFLEHLEQERGNSVRSRNIRLAAIRSLFRFIALRDPDSVGVATRIMAIPRKREDKKLVGYLTREEVEALLAAPDRKQWAGRRDHALLLTMYNSGARVSELASLQRNQVRTVPALSCCSTEKDARNEPFRSGRTPRGYFGHGFRNRELIQVKSHFRMHVARP
jgi:integrase/recombinase XerD